MLFERADLWDPEKMIREVLDVMVELAKSGMTMILRDEMGFARTVASRVIFMDRGEIIEQNEKPEEFFKNPKSEAPSCSSARSITTEGARAMRRPATVTAALYRPPSSRAMPRPWMSVSLRPSIISSARTQPRRGPELKPMPAEAEGMEQPGAAAGAGPTSASRRPE